MRQENIEEISTEKLLKRKKFFAWIMRVYLIVILVFLVAIILEVTQDDFDSTTLIIAGVCTSQIWLPVMMLSKINKELERRGKNSRL